MDFEGNKRTFPIQQMENIHVFGEVDFNTKLFNLVNQSDIFVHMYSHYGYYAGSFVPRNKQISGYVDIKQASYYIDHEKRMFLAKQFVKSAVHHMLRNVRKRKNVPVKRINKMEQEREKIESASKIDELMGIEGRIRSSYFSIFNHIIKNSYFQFEKRVRKPPKDPINALISFGNSLMYTTVLSLKIQFLKERYLKEY